MSDAASPLDGLDLPPGFAERVGATPERLADVESFRAMLARTNATMNLVGDSTLASYMNGKNLFNFGPVLGYYFRKNDPNRKNNFNMKTMHFINKLSLAMFLVCLVVMLFRYVL